MKAFGTPAWVGTLSKYLELFNIKPGNMNLTPAINSDATFQHRLLDRLASFAVEDIYLDGVQKLEEPETDGEKLSSPAEDDEKALYLSLVPPTNRCLATMQLPQLPSNAPKHQILAALRAIYERVRTEPEEVVINPQEVKVALKAIPSGVNVQNHSVQIQELIKVMRLIHGQDLRNTQSVINRSICRLQDITSDPKTESSLYTPGA